MTISSSDSLARDLTGDRAAMEAELTARGSTIRGNTATCPWPDTHGGPDQQPSGSIHQALNGHWRFRCHKCDRTADVLDLRAEREGRTPADILQAERKAVIVPNIRQTPRPQTVFASPDAIRDFYYGLGFTLVARYDYSPDWIRFRFIDREGVKTFRPATRTAGRWICKDPPAPRPLYCRDVIAGATTVVVVEGEGKCNRMNEIGIACVTSSGGAQGAGKSDWSSLAGKAVVIMPDNDTAGAKYARDVAGILLPICLGVSQVDVSVLELDDGEDVADLLERMGDATKDEKATIVREILATARKDGVKDVFTPVTEGRAHQPKDGKGSAKPRLLVTSFSDTIEEEPYWLWNGWLLRKATIVLGGRQGSGKGIIVVDIIARLTTGRPMPDGTGGGDPINVLIITREDDPHMSLKARLRAAGADMARVLWSTGDYGIGADDVGHAAASMKEAAALIEAAIVEYGIGMVVIDPLGAWVENDGNSSAEVRAVIDPMNQVARRTGCAVLFVAHLRKADADVAMDAFSGSNAVTAAVRVAWMAGELIGSERSLAVVKSNFRQPSWPMVWTMVPGPGEDPPTIAWRVGTKMDAAAIAQRQAHRAVLIPPSVILPLMAQDHRPFKEEARRIKNALHPSTPTATVKAVEDAMAAAVAEGEAFEGIGLRGTRTIGTKPSIPVETATDRAIKAWEAEPDATVREIADTAKCSSAQAGRARGLARRSVPSPCLMNGDEVRDKETEVRDKDNDLVSPLPCAPFKGRGGGRDETESARERGGECPVPSPSHLSEVPRSDPLVPIDAPHVSESDPDDLGDGLGENEEPSPPAGWPETQPADRER